MDESQLFEPGYFNQFVTEAYTGSVENAEYIQILTDLPYQDDSQDILLNSLSYDELSEYTIIYIFNSLCTIFNHNKSIINKYLSVFKDFFLNNFIHYPRTPAILQSLSNLFVVLFRDNRDLAKTILQSMNDKFFTSILSSSFVASTMSMIGLSNYFERVLESFSQHDIKWKMNSETIQNFLLFSKMLSFFKGRNIPPQLIELIIKIGGPKSLLNSVNFMNADESFEFLKSLEIIINLPIKSFKSEPVRLNYLIEFIEGTVDLLLNKKEGKIVSELSVLMLELRNCNSIRSLKNIEFLNDWLSEIFQITIECLNSQFLEEFPFAIENWMEFWSMIFEFQSYRDISEFKDFSNQLIENLISEVIPFLIENSTKICESYVNSDDSSNFFDYFSKICQNDYSQITDMICESFETKTMEEIMWHLEFAKSVITSHLNSPESLEFIDDDMKLMKSFINISSTISPELDQLFEYLLISFYYSFIFCYFNKKTKSFVNVYVENSSVFIYYLKRIIENLSFQNLPDKSIRLFVKQFDFKFYPQQIIDQIFETPEIIQKVVAFDFPFCNEDDKKKEVNDFYGYFFSILQFNKSQLNEVMTSLLIKMNSNEIVPYTLRLYCRLFELLKQNIEFVYSFHFNNFFQIISDMANFEYKEENLPIHRNLAKLLSVIANSNETNLHFKFMSEQMICLFKSTLNLLSILLQNSKCDDKVLHFSISAINSFIKNKSLNLTVLNFYGDFVFDQFISEFSVLLKLIEKENEFLNQKVLNDLISLFELIIVELDALQQPYLDLCLFVLNEIIIKKIRFFSQKAVMKSVSVLIKSFHFFEFLIENNKSILDNLLIALIDILPILKSESDKFCSFYMNLFILEKDEIVKIVESLSSGVLDDDKFDYLMQNLIEFLNCSSEFDRHVFSNILKFIKESVIMKDSTSFS